MRVLLEPDQSEVSTKRALLGTDAWLHREPTAMNEINEEKKEFQQFGLAIKIAAHK